jgi:2-isopropylmalate synthase
MAVANTLSAVAAGAGQAQGTINGYGERCGNANLCSIIPNLKLKMGIACVTDEQLAKLTEVSRYISEAANLAPETSAPYVGLSSFSHKAGLHVSAISKWTESYQHVDPAKVGNSLRVLVSELAGKKNIIFKAKEIGVDLPARGEEAQRLLTQVKALESKGFQYDNAEASFELLVHRARPGYVRPFELVDYMIVVEKSRRPATQDNGEDLLSEAMVKVKIHNEILHTAAEGNGPVNALDAALRKTLCQYYPSVNEVKLVDYKVRILEESTGTGSFVRVLIESANGGLAWRTVGSSANIIEASWLALADSLEYWLVKQRQTKSGT